MANRIDSVRGRLDDLETDALLLTALPNIRWACGFTGSNGLLLVGSHEVIFVTDGRYTDQAHDEVDGAEVHVTRSNLFAYLEEETLLSSFDRIAFQADSITVAQLDELEDRFNSVEWIPTEQLVTRLVGRKDDSEVNRIRRAQRITESVFEETLDFIQPGQTEKEVAAEIVYRHLRHGADSMSFDPIVASGPNAARPHAHPTDRRLRRGDMIVLDMGCFRDGYASDMTRTVALGEPSEEARRGYELVRQAQEEALTAARAGLTGKELDAVARGVIDSAGLGESFSHGLGHGIGLQVHEWPRVSHTAEDELPPGACVTIEPGVYVPEEGYGVRIEDIVVLREQGCENLTRSRKSLVTL